MSDSVKPGKPGTKVEMHPNLDASDGVERVYGIGEASKPAEHRWGSEPAVAVIKGSGAAAISIELIDGLADQYLRGNSSDYAKRAFARAIEQMALANAGALPRLDEAATTTPDLQALRAAYEASAAALAAQEALGKAKVAEVVSVLLWLYRRLPRGYGRMPFVDLVIKKLAKGAGIDVTELLGEREVGGAPAAPVGRACGRPAIVDVGSAISAAAVEASLHGAADADMPANDPATAGGAPPARAQQDPALAVRDMRAQIDAASEAGQLDGAGADKLHRKIRRAERLVTEVQCGLWPMRRGAKP